jgi:hypothetical protein
VIQYSLLERAVPSPETVATLTARLGALVGDARCGTAVLLDTYCPDAFEMRRFELPEQPAAPRARHATADVAENAAAGVASRPAAGGSSSSIVAPVLRRFRPAVAVRVSIAHGRPVQIAIDRRGMPGGAVDRCAGPWRTSGAWWTAPAGQWDRDEWDVALRDGTLCRLFRTRDTGAWFMEGVLD